MLLKPFAALATCAYCVEGVLSALWSATSAASPWLLSTLPSLLRLQVGCCFAHRGREREREEVAHSLQLNWADADAPYPASSMNLFVCDAYYQ